METRLIQGKVFCAISRNTTLIFHTNATFVMRHSMLGLSVCSIKTDQHSGDWNVLKDKNHIDSLEHFEKVMNAIVNQNLGPNADSSMEDYKVHKDKFYVHFLFLLNPLVHHSKNNFCTLSDCVENFTFYI